MSKRMIVATTGNFALACLTTAQEIDAFRPSVISPSAFFSSRMGLNQVNILVDNLPELANDKDFADTLKECDGDVRLAIDAYVAEVEKAYAALDDEESEKAKALFDAQELKKAEEDAQALLDAQAMKEALDLDEAKKAEAQALKDAQDKADAEAKALKDAQDKAEADAAAKAKKDAAKKAAAEKAAE